MAPSGARLALKIQCLSIVASTAVKATGLIEIAYPEGCRLLSRRNNKTSTRESLLVSVLLLVLMVGDDDDGDAALLPPDDVMVVVVLPPFAAPEEVALGRTWPCVELLPAPLDDVLEPATPTGPPAATQPWHERRRNHFFVSNGHEMRRIPWEEEEEVAMPRCAARTRSFIARASLTLAFAMSSMRLLSTGASDGSLEAGTAASVVAADCGGCCCCLAASTRRAHERNSWTASRNCFA